MIITIPKSLQRQVKKYAQALEITEREYVVHAVRNYASIAPPPTNHTLKEELSAWRSKVRKSSLRFWKKHDL